MFELLKSEYWSKSLAFLVPLTHLTKSQKYPMMSYLYWDNYSIDNCQLILKFDYDNINEFTRYCRQVIFPILDKGGYLLEVHDFEGFSIFILDLSIWTFDIQLFLDGKYSKLSRDAKKSIIDYHKHYDQGPKIDVSIHAILEPSNKFPILGNMTALEYVADSYGMSLDLLKKVGEIGSKYDKEKETLVITDKVAEIEDKA